MVRVVLLPRVSLEAAGLWKCRLNVRAITALEIQVSAGIYRSSFPKKKNFEFMRGLRLKTVL